MSHLSYFRTRLLVKTYVTLLKPPRVAVIYRGESTEWLSSLSLQVLSLETKGILRRKELNDEDVTGGDGGDL